MPFCSCETCRTTRTNTISEEWLALAQYEADTTIKPTRTSFVIRNIESYIAGKQTWEEALLKMAKGLQEALWLMQKEMYDLLLTKPIFEPISSDADTKKGS